jgi:hypothetical protein
VTGKSGWITLAGAVQLLLAGSFVAWLLFFPPPGRLLVADDDGC